MNTPEGLDPFCSVDGDDGGRPLALDDYLGLASVIPRENLHSIRARSLCGELGAMNRIRRDLLHSADYGYRRHEMQLGCSNSFIGVGILRW